MCIIIATHIAQQALLRICLFTSSFCVFFYQRQQKNQLEFRNACHCMLWDIFVSFLIYGGMPARSSVASDRCGCCWRFYCFANDPVSPVLQLPSRSLHGQRGGDFQLSTVNWFVVIPGVGYCAAPLCKSKRQ